MKILIFSDNIGNYGELCAAANSLGGEVSAFLVANKSVAETVPATKVYYAEHDESQLFENYYPTLKNLVFNENPDLILVSATRRGKYMSARLAAALKTTALTDLASMEANASGIKGVQMYYGGAAVRTVKSKGKVVATLPLGSFEPVSGVAGEIVKIPYIDDGTRLKKVETRAKSCQSVNLAAAKKVIGVGRGFSKKEDLVLAETLARIIGGEVGCSRPIAEGEGWMDTSRYVGISGVTLNPDIYLAIGVSGQIQHIIGVGAARVIIAVNKDKNAPIFKVCDYGIVGDLYKVIPALTGMFEGRNE